jgi:hypothetical protein
MRFQLLKNYTITGLLSQEIASRFVRLARLSVQPLIETA